MGKSLKSISWSWKFKEWSCQTHVSSAGTNAETLLIGLHGFTGSGADFAPLLGQLPVGTRFEAPDLPGHGLSATWESAECVSMEACDAMLLERIQRADNRRVILMGYSMGGRVALHFASRFSHLLDSIVVIGASPGIVNETDREQRLSWEQELCERLLDGGVPGFMDYWQKLDIIRSQYSLPPALLEPMQERRAKASVDGLIESIRGMGTGRMQSLWSVLPKIHCPLLYCAGEDDRKYCELGKEVVELIPEAQLSIIPGKVGHAAHLEGLELFGEIFRVWLNERTIPA